MSPTLRLSIAANVLLLGTVATLLWHDRRAAAPPSVAHPPTPPASVRIGTSATIAAGGESPPPSTGGQLNPDAVAQLEQLGISRDTLVNALLEGFHRRWDQRFADLQRKYAPRPVPERENIELGRLRDAEQVRELKAALGEGGYLAWDRDRTLRLLNNGGVTFSPEEAGQAYRLQKEFETQHRELQMAMEDGIADPADAGKMQEQARRDLDAALAKLFGQERFDQVRGLASPVADVAWRLAHLGPTPTQAQQVLQAEAAHREREAALARQLADDPADGGRLTAALQAARHAREESMRQIFGQTYDALSRQNDATYQSLQQYSAAWNLQPAEVESVYDALHSFREQAELTRTVAVMRESAGQRVNWREIDSAIEQARLQAEDGLQTLLGPQRLQRLKQNGFLASR